MLKKGVQTVILLCGIVVLCNLLCKTPQDNTIRTQEQVSSTAGFVVQVEEEKGSFFYDPEELLPRMVLSVLPVSYEEMFQPELLKTLFVLCRTNLWNYWEQQGKKEMICLQLGTSPLPILSEADYRQICEQQIPKNHRNDILEAQKATKGIILSFQGEVIEAPFFFLSSGRTRSAKELFPSESYPYLNARECKTDMQHQDYLQQNMWQSGEFYQKLMGLLIGKDSALQLLETQQLTWSDFTVEKTIDGYVKYIEYQPEHIRVDANAFQEEFSLASPCILVEERNQTVVIETKGVGHGFGLSICYAATLAQEKKTYEEILFYFYENVALERRYNVSYALENCHRRKSERFF